MPDLSASSVRPPILPLRTDRGCGAAAKRSQTNSMFKKTKTMLKKIFSLTAAALLLFACTDDEWPAQPDWSQIPHPDEEVDDGLLTPAA